jgi:hypothetical protein
MGYEELAQCVGVIGHREATSKGWVPTQSKLGLLVVRERIFQMSDDFRAEGFDVGQMKCMYRKPLPNIVPPVGYPGR